MPFLSPEMTSDAECFNYTRQLLREWLPRVIEGKYKLHVPNRVGHMQAIPQMTFHSTPELFLQISGVTTFEFPSQKFEVGPGHICLVPRGMPHKEKVRPLRGPFYNLVFDFGGEVLFYHLACERITGKPWGFSRNFICGLNMPYLSEQLSHVEEWWLRGTTVGKQAAQSAMTQYLYIILQALENPPSTSSEQTFKIMHLHGMLRQNICNPQLSVNWISHNMHTNPDYISRLFRKATGQTLGNYILRQRLAHARQLLETSTLNVAEIGQMVGYENPTYFSRLFRHFHKLTPREYRSQHIRNL